MKRKHIVNQDSLSPMQAYELEMLKMTERMVRTLLKHNLQSKEQILNIYDKMLDFSNDGFNHTLLRGKA